MTSMGRGKIMVEFFSADIEFKVWKKEKEKILLTCLLRVGNFIGSTIKYRR